MICPACSVKLLSARPQKIHIQFCPKCGGVWLESEEMNKMLRLAEADAAAVVPGVRSTFYGSCRTRR